MARYDLEQLLADWRTGGYSQQELADKHKTSRPNVARLVKGVDKDLTSTLTRKVESEQELAELTDKELTSVNEQAKQLIEDAKMIRALTKNNMVGVGVKLTNHAELSMLDHKNAQDLIDKASITLGVNERHAKPTNVQQNTQNNTVARVTFRRATKADRDD